MLKAVLANECKYVFIRVIVMHEVCSMIDSPSLGYVAEQSRLLENITNKTCYYVFRRLISKVHIFVCKFSVYAIFIIHPLHLPQYSLCILFFSPPFCMFPYPTEP